MQTRSKTSGNQKQKVGNKKQKVEFVEEFEELVEVVEEEREDILSGLTLTRDGKSIQIDDELLERLRSVAPKPTIPKIDPYTDYPVYQKILQTQALPLDFLSQCDSSMTVEDKRLAEIISGMPLDWLAMQTSKTLTNTWEYNVKLTTHVKTADQQSKGLCWAYAFLNVFRYSVIAKFSLESKFEFSESYFFFYDKLERSNLFLEYMWIFACEGRPLNDRDVRLFTGSGGDGHMLSDGGCHNYAVNLFKKYGAVPKHVYGDSFNSRTSVYLNENLQMILNHFALEIFRGDTRNKKRVWSRKTFEKKKGAYMQIVYKLLVKFLGKPPAPNDTFTWIYRDSDDKSHSMPGLTPEKFSRVIMDMPTDLICIIHDPRHPETYYQSCFSPYSTNMIGGTSSHSLNLPIEEFKKVVAESLKNDCGVWMACDMGKCFDYDTGISDTNQFNYNWILGTDVQFSKSDMLDMHTSFANHAMMFDGVDTIEKEGEAVGYNRWRIFNSWGDNCADEDSKDHGRYQISDDYFTKYVSMAAVSLKFFEQDALQKISDNMQSGKSFTYDYTDSMATQAMRAPCSHCKKQGDFRKKK